MCYRLKNHPFYAIIKSMKIALLGYGKEGQASEEYFSKRGAEFKIYDHFTDEEIAKEDFSEFDLVLRSPSVRPLPGVSSMTKYFFDHCPCPIIGVTGTKGKGTTCCLTTAILKATGQSVYLVGNIGIPSISILDDLKSDDVVVYEMSSFQLWDLTKSPHIAVLVRVEQDHLDRHYDINDYWNAKGHIAKYQTADDYCIYYKYNENSKRLAALSKGTKIAYPVESEKITALVNDLGVPGDHNKENAKAAIVAAASFYKMSVDDFVDKHFDKIHDAFVNFHSLPHRIEFVRELNNVKYYDDNYSATYPSLDVAVKVFKDFPTILIAGGKDRGLDLTPNKKVIFESTNIKKAILIGETREKLAAGEDESKYEFTDTLDAAVARAQVLAESFGEPAIVLMSPGAASFDMFKNFSERGDLFHKYVEELK